MNSGLARARVPYISSDVPEVLRGGNFPTGGTYGATRRRYGHFFIFFGFGQRSYIGGITSTVFLDADNYNCEMTAEVPTA